MAKRKFYSFFIIFISIVLTLMISLQAGDSAYAEVIERTLGNNKFYGVDIPLDLYGSDETTTNQVQKVAPGSTFQVTFSQDNTGLVGTMVNVLSNLGSDEISRYSDDISVYFFLPADVDTSGITESSFTLEGSYSLFDISEISQINTDQINMIEVSFTPKISYTSVKSMLEAWQSAGTDAKITLSGLTVPSSYTIGDVFYVSALPLGMVRAVVGDIQYGFEVKTYQSEDGYDKHTETFSDGDTDKYRAHVTFEVSETDTTDADEIAYSDVDASLKWVENDGTTADTSEHETVYLKLYRSVNASNSAAENASAKSIKTASAGSSSVLTSSVSSVDAEAVEGAELKKIETSSGENTVKVTWNDLPETNSSGQEYTYYVKEVDSNGNDYTPAGYSKIEDGLVVTNIKDIDYTDVKAVKKWVEHDGTTADTSSHPTIYFKLYRSVNGGDPEAVSGEEVKKIKTATGKSSSKVIWTNLPETNSAGQEYTYMVKEVNEDGNDYTPSGYKKTEDGLTVTNTLQRSSTSKNNTDDQNSADSGHKKNDTNNTNEPKTGDETNAYGWFSILALSAGALTTLRVKRRKH